MHKDIDYSRLTNNNFSTNKENIPVTKFYNDTNMNPLVYESSIENKYWKFKTLKLYCSYCDKIINTFLKVVINKKLYTFLFNIVNLLLFLNIIIYFITMGFSRLLYFLWWLCINFQIVISIIHFIFNIKIKIYKHYCKNCYKLILNN